MRSGHDVMCLTKISYNTFAALVASNLWEGICFGCSSLAVFGHHELVDLHICVVFMVSVFSIHVDVCLAKSSYTTFAALVASNLWEGICFGCSSLAVFGHHKLVDLQTVFYPLCQHSRFHVDLFTMVGCLSSVTV